MARTFPHPADQLLVSFTLRFTRRRWAELRLEAAKAGTSIAVFIHNRLAPQPMELPVSDTKSPAGEAAEKAVTLKTINAPDPGDPTRLDELAKRQPCAGKPGEWVPPATSFKTD